MKQLNDYRLLKPASRKAKPAPQPRKVVRYVSTMLRWTAPALLAASMTANAADPLICKAEIIATIDAGIAMQPMTISAYQDDKLIESTPRHSAVMHLPCGLYTIRIQHNTLTRSRQVNLAGDGATVVIEMGE
jgi:hypothetical protein